MGSSNSKPRKQLDIDELIEVEKLKASLQFKILLLGAGESGKSTVLKQLRLTYKRNEMTEEYFKTFIPTLHQNILSSMQTLLEAAAAFEYSFESQEDKDAAKRIAEIQIAGDTPALTEDLALDVHRLWKTPQIQSTYKRRDEFWLLESCSYYFERVHQYADEGYIPNEEDIIMARARTTGIIETQFDRGDIQWKVVDVGGQRSERKKWANCFSGVHAVLFIVNLAGYNSVLFEDQKRNRMLEEIDLFREVCGLAPFKDKPIFLFLNKKDLFEKKYVQLVLQQFFQITKVNRMMLMQI